VGQAAAVVTIFGSLYGSTGAFNDGVNAALAAPLFMDSALYLSAPLAVTYFDVKFIQKQTSSPGFSNRISITLSTSTLLPAIGAPLELRIEICCLTGFTSPEDLFVTSPPEIQKESWDLSAGRLVMRVVGDLQAADSYSISFLGLNSMVGQDFPSVIISITQGGSKLVSRAMDKGQDEQQPLIINEFMISDISQSATSQGAQNTITVSIATRLFISADAPPHLLLICNLVGVSTPSQSSLPIQDVGGTGANADLAYVGSWTQDLFRVNYQPFKRGCLSIQPRKTISKKVYVFSQELGRLLPSTWTRRTSNCGGGSRVVQV
jgi:hypothetical protein